MNRYLDHVDSSTDILIFSHEKKLLLETIKSVQPSFLRNILAEVKEDRKEIRLSMLCRLKGLEFKLKDMSYTVSLTRGELNIALNIIAQLDRPNFLAADLFAALLRASYPEKTELFIAHERSSFLAKSAKPELYRSPFTGELV